METPSFKHFVLTRFNIVTNWSADKSGNKTQTEEWLKRRFELFDEFCFPSIVNQSAMNFYWMVLFSINTPEKYKNKISEYTKAFPGFIPVYLQDGEDSSARLKNEIKALLNGTETHVITTRIDNDDAFHKNAVSLAQQAFKAQEDVFLSFNNGLQYDTDNHVLGEFRIPKNAFISRIEKIKNNGIDTVYAGVHHTKIHEVAKVEYIDTYPSWLQIIHDGNVANTIRIKISMLKFSTSTIRDFNIKHEAKISLIGSCKAGLAYVFKKAGKKIKRVLKIKEKEV
jgi:hypothetical protein